MAPAALASTSPSLFAGLPARRAALLLAALDLFVEQGYEATSVPEVARRARVATGTIYLHFRSKDELVNALLAHLRARLTAELEAALDAADGVRAGFDAAWGVFARYVLEHPRAVAFCDLHHHAPYLRAATVLAWEPARRRLEAHLRAGRRAGVYRDEPEGVLRALFAGPLIALAKFARMGELRLTPAVLGAAAESVWAGLQRPGARRPLKEGRA